MRCVVYKGLREPDAYLYVREASILDELPEALTQRLGSLSVVMHLDLARRDRLARVEIDQVRQALADEGYFLQMPPPKHLLAYGQTLAGE